MKIEHLNEADNKMFYVGEATKPDAETVYSMRNKTMVIEHTVVRNSMRGQHVGEALIEAAVDYARTHHLKIKPLCSYAASLFHKKPEWNDVLE